MRTKQHFSTKLIHVKNKSETKAKKEHQHERSKYKRTNNKIQLNKYKRIKLIE